MSTRYCSHSSRTCLHTQRTKGGLQPGKKRFLLLVGLSIVERLVGQNRNRYLASKKANTQFLLLSSLFRPFQDAPCIVVEGTLYARYVEPQLSGLSRWLHAPRSAHLWLESMWLCLSGHTLGLCWPAIRNEMGNFLHHRIWTNMFLKFVHKCCRNWRKGQDVNLLISIWIRILINAGAWRLCDVEISPFLVNFKSHFWSCKTITMLKPSGGWMKRLV